MLDLPELFLLVFNMSLTASYAALAIILFRYLFLKKMPRLFSYTLWCVLLFRLVSPVSFSSGFSLVNLYKPAWRETAGAAEGAVISAPGPVKAPLSGAALEGAGDTPLALAPTAGLTQAEAGVAGISPVEAILAVAALIWLLGILILLTYSVVKYYKLILRLKNAFPLDNPAVAGARASLGLKRRVEVYVSGQVENPFVCGFLIPKIYIPARCLDKDLSYILMHEMAHVKRYDYLLKPFAYLLVILHWFNPFVWLSYRLMSSDMEMSCDEKVMTVLGRQNRQAYSYALLSLATPKNSPLPDIPPAFGDGIVKSRIKNILSFKRPGPLPMAAVALLMCGIGFAALANPLAPDFRDAFAPDYLEIQLAGEMKSIGLSAEETEAVSALLERESWDKGVPAGELSGPGAQLFNGGDDKVISIYKDHDGSDWILLNRGFGRRTGGYYRAPENLFDNLEEYFWAHYSEHDSYLQQNKYAVRRYVDEMAPEDNYNNIIGIWIKLPFSFEGGAPDQFLQERCELSREKGYDYSGCLGRWVYLYAATCNYEDYLVLLAHQGEIIGVWYDQKEGLSLLKEYTGTSPYEEK